MARDYLALPATGNFPALWPHRTQANTCSERICFITALSPQLGEVRRAHERWTGWQEAGRGITITPLRTTTFLQRRNCQTADGKSDSTGQMKHHRHARFR